MTAITSTGPVAADPSRNMTRYLLTGLLVLAAALPFLVGKSGFISNFTFLQMSLMIVYAIAVLGLNLLTGFNGQISLGHGAFFAVGAYTAAILIEHYGVNYWLTLPVAAMLWREGYSCLMFDSRAHGKSGGKLTGLGFDERVDVAAALDWLDQNAPGQDVVIYGSSMGAAAASFAAAENPGRLRGLILDSAYSRLLDAVSGWWYFVGGKKLASLLYPTRWISRLFLKQPLGRIDVAEALAEAGDLPVLFLHGDSDTLASPDAARRNMEAVGDRGQIVWFPGCGHSEGRWNYPGEFNRAVLTFLAEVAPARAEHASRQTNSADLA